MTDAHSKLATNRLSTSKSPYLLQHKDNPVHWQEWSNEALAEAKRLDKPILLSVGYAACHWCHVMAHESFEDEATAELMNELFVNIKVDREERPDIDQIYVTALHATGEQGGWPLTMFLTPDGGPFWARTRFPPKPAYGRPSFTQVMQAVARTYTTDFDRVEVNRATIQSHLMADPKPASETITHGHIKQAAKSLLNIMDPEVGGTKSAPKFPQSSLQQFLLNFANVEKSSEALETVERTQLSISQGGIYDHLAGGIARYTVDTNWLVPHFEKMLYDNAQYISLLCQLTNSEYGELFRYRIESTADFILKDMLDETGGFYSSYDADSEGAEGKFYTFQEEEIDHLLEGRAEDFKKAYDISTDGNWEEQNILNRSLNSSISESIDVEQQHIEDRNILLNYRNNRVWPGLDDKILTDWSAMMVSALATASVTLEKNEYLTAAIKAAKFLLEPLKTNGKLAHSYRDGSYLFPAMATDYANLTQACLTLFKVTQQDKWLINAQKLTDVLNRHYWDTNKNRLYLSSDEADDLIMRPAALNDDAVPGASGTTVSNLITLFTYTGEQAYLAQADKLIETASESMMENAFQTSGLWSAFQQRLSQKSITILTDEIEPLANRILSGIVSNPYISLIILDNTDALPENHPAYGKKKIGGQTTAYICSLTSCSPSVTDMNQLFDYVD